MKIKQILFMLSMLGLVSNLFSQSPGTSNKSYKLTDDEGDSIIAVEDPFDFSTDIDETRFGFIRQYSESDLDAITKSNGTAAGRSGLFAITGGEWINNPDTNAYDYVASSAKLEPVEDLGDFAGAPLVADVHAKQIPGSKNVEVRFWLQYDSSKSSEVYIEVWFRESSSELQWERCMEIDKAEHSNTLTKKFGYNPETYANDLLVAHTRSGSGWVWFEWDAGTEKSNFKGNDCQIRVMAIYPKEDPNYPGTFLPEEQQGSGWDGYQTELGDMFVRTSDPQVDVKNPDYPDVFSSNEYFLAHIEQNNITRQGTAIIDGKNFPVYSLSADDFQAVTGIAGTAGNYAFSGINQYDTDEFGNPLYECIIGRVIPQSL
jgi:hypothetical protein